MQSKASLTEIKSLFRASRRNLFQNPQAYNKIIQYYEEKIEDNLTIVTANVFEKMQIGQDEFDLSLQLLVEDEDVRDAVNRLGKSTM